MLCIYMFLGSVFASFIGVAVYRIPRQLPIGWSRSFCPNCHHQLQWYDLIPIVSWLWLNGKCRNCYYSLAIKDCIIEVLGLYIGTHCYLREYPVNILLFILGMGFFLLYMAFYDLETLCIPNHILGIGIFLTIWSFWIYSEIDIYQRGIGMVLVSGILFLCTYYIPNSFGGGDIKLFGVLGAMVGWEQIIIIFIIAIWSAGIVASYQILRQKVTTQEYLPFGPFIAFATWIVIIF